MKIAKIATKSTILLDALGCDRAEVSVFLTDDRDIQELNRTWLGRDRPTDVIAWSQLEGPAMPTDFIGDVVISLETAARQAEELGHSLDHEINRLLAHGFLHLLGHDHVKGGARARKMRAREDELVAMLDRRESA
jgi:probable rRNA maturation factor